MIRRVISTTFKVKRGHTDALKAQNPFLEDGEPCFDLDNGKLKIGDGIHRYDELGYIGDDNVFSAKTMLGFPSVGEPNVIYKAEESCILYQWNTEKLIYEELKSSSGTIGEIDMISGGSATTFSNK